MPVTGHLWPMDVTVSPAGQGGGTEYLEEPPVQQSAELGCGSSHWEKEGGLLLSSPLFRPAKVM